MYYPYPDGSSDSSLPPLSNDVEAEHKRLLEKARQMEQDGDGIVFDEGEDDDENDSRSQKGSGSRAAEARVATVLTVWFAVAAAKWW